MATVEQDGGHVEQHLGVFVLGALSSVEDQAVARHLVACARCAAEAAGLQDVRRLLDRLTGDNVEELMRRHKSLSDRPRQDLARRDPAPLNPAPPNPAPANPEPADPGRRNPGPRGARPARGPSRKGKGVKPRSGRPSRWSVRTWVVLTSVVVALGIGTGIGAWLSTRSPVDIRLAGEQTDSQSGVSVSVMVVGSPSGAHVEAVIEGLTADEAYRLYTVGDRGETQLAAAWTGTGSVQGVAGDVTIPSARLTAVTLARSDGQVIVTVRLARSSARR